MIGKLDESLNFHATALALRTERQQLLASNIANSDTPGYQARDFDFAAALRAATSPSSLGGAATSPSSLGGAASSPADIAARATTVQYRAATQAALDNNSVDIDVERAQFADNTVRYEATLKFLNNQIKTMLAAIQG